MAFKMATWSRAWIASLVAICLALISTLITLADVVVVGGAPIGDASVIPKFREELEATTEVYELAITSRAGGMPAILNTLLIRDIPMPGDRFMPDGGGKLREDVLSALGHLNSPSAMYHRLFAPSRAVAFLGPFGRVILVSCDVCGTAYLGQVSDVSRGESITSPQFSFDERTDLGSK